MRKMNMTKNAKKVLALGLAVAMVVPASFATDKTTASAETAPVPAKYYDFEKGFRGDGSNGIIAEGKELDVVEVGRWIQFLEYLDANKQKPLDEFGRATGAYQSEDTVFASKSWTAAAAGYEKVKVPAGMEKQQVPDFKTDNGEFFFRGTANQGTTAYDVNKYDTTGSVQSYGKGNVFWLGNTMTNQSYPTYATTADYENGTYTTNADVIVKDMIGQTMEFGINNSATEFSNPYTGSAATGFSFSTWLKNTNEYKPEIIPTILGDVDANEAINAGDALAVLKHVAKVELLGDKQVLFANVNGDTAVNAGDALDILKFAAKMITEFTGSTPDVGGGEEAKFLDNTELVHFEKREETVPTQTWYSVLDRTKAREYLYFTANSVVYVPDYTDSSKYCTWTLAEELKGDDLDLLNAKNGDSWNYLTYSFDGTNFHMYVNGTERTLTKNVSAGYETAGADILSFVKESGTESFLGGLGGGMKDNFTTFAIETNEDFYMDDIALYTQHIDATTAATVYTEADTKVKAATSRTVNKLKNYAFEGSSLSANGLIAVSGADSSMLPTVEKAVDGRSNVIKTVLSAQTSHGGTYLESNPFAGRDELTGATVSYWMKAIPNKRGVVTDGVMLSFIDEAKACVHEKVGDAYLGANAIARSQLSFNLGYIGNFCEGQTKPLGGASLKNIFNFRPYTFGDPATQVDKRLSEFCEPSWTNYKDFLKRLGDRWYYVTITITDAGFKMYIDGEEVKNQYMDLSGPRFYDSSWDRINDAFVNGTNNSGARTLMNLVTDSTTKIYLGYAFEQGSETNYQKATNSYIDDISFYDADMNSAEVKALYESVK